MADVGTHGGGDGRPQSGFYCSTSGTYFTDKESLTEHYKSDFHRYNLKRKVAGLPPVTKDWFEARKAQLSSAAGGAEGPAAQKVWFDPLTRKRFSSENTFLAYTRSKRYGDLVRASGLPAPAPVIMLRQQPAAPPAGEDGGGAPAGGANAAPAGYTVKLPSGGLPRRPPAALADSSDEEPVSEAEEGASSGWETVSEDEAAEEAEGDEGAGQEQQDEEGDWEDWDVCVSFFDNHRSASMQDNLEYMYRNFGFYLPDAAALADPEGLLKYLGAKLRYGRVPLYTSGDDANAKQFRSVHAVQRHMVDTNQCKLRYDGNEEEYEDYYDYSAADQGGAGDDGQAEREQAGTLVVQAGTGGESGRSGAGGLELAVPAQAGVPRKVLGLRQLARYYKQRPRPADARASAGALVARYQVLGIETVPSAQTVEKGVKAAQRFQHRRERERLNLALRTNINRNLPKNVTY